MLGGGGGVLAGRRLGRRMVQSHAIEIGYWRGGVGCRKGVINPGLIG